METTFWVFYSVNFVRFMNDLISGWFLNANNGKAALEITNNFEMNVISSFIY